MGLKTYYPKRDRNLIASLKVFYGNKKPTKNLKIIVWGERDKQDRILVFRILSDLHYYENPIEEIWTNNLRHGVTGSVTAWCKLNNVKRVVKKARKDPNSNEWFWKERAASLIADAPDLVITIGHNQESKYIKKLARKAGIEVREFDFYKWV